VQSVEEAVKRYFDCACELLSPHELLIGDLGSLLAERRELSWRTVAARLREYRKRLRRETQEHQDSEEKQDAPASA